MGGIHCCSGWSFSAKYDHSGVSCGVHSLFPSVFALFQSLLPMEIHYKMIMLVLASTYLEDNGAAEV